MKKIDMGWVLGVILVVAIGGMMGCRKKAEPAPGIAEETGAALDRAAEKTVDMANEAGEKASEAAESAKEATGRAMEKTGAAIEKTGEDMQKQP